MNTQYLALFATIMIDSGLTQFGFRAQSDVVVLASTSQDVLVQRPQRSLLPITSEVPPPPDRGAPDGRTDGASRNTNYFYISQETTLVSHQEDPPSRESG